MSHNLNETNGKTSMMYVGETPWHKLGTKLDKPATAAGAIKAAGLDFTVQVMSLRVEHADIPIDRHFATVRMDTFEALGVVGARYQPIQNRDAFTVFDSLVGEGEAIYHTAGVLGKGERIWLLAKLPDYIRVNGNDLVEKFLLLTNSHDGSEVVRVRLTPIRVVCENTLVAALSGSEQEVRIRHTASATDKLKEAHKVLGLTNQLYNQLEQVFNGMSAKKMGNLSLTEYLNLVFPGIDESSPSRHKSHVKDTLLQLVESGRGSDMAKGTLWGAYNSVTEFVDHHRQPTAEPSQRLKSMWFGSGEQIKKKAFRVAVGMMTR